MTRRLFFPVLAAITVFGAWLRWSELAAPSLWLDEILHLTITQQIDWSHPLTFLLGLQRVDGYSENGSLYYLLQSLGQSLAPGDLGVRVLPAAIGTLTVPIFGVVARQFADQRDRDAVGLTAAFALAVGPLHVYYSREGRPYYLLVLLAVLLIGLLARCTQPLGGMGRRWFLGLTALSLLGSLVGLHALPVFGSAAALTGLLLMLELFARRTGGAATLQQPTTQPLHLIVVLLFLGAALGLSAVLYLSRSEVNRPTVELREEQQQIVDAPVFEAPVSERSLRRFAASMTTAGHVSNHVGERAILFFVLAGVGLVSLLLRRENRQSAAASDRDDGRPRHLAMVAGGMFVLPAVTSVLALLTTGRWYHVRYTAAALPGFLLLASIGVVAITRWCTTRLEAVHPGRASRLAAPVLVVTAVAVVMAPNRGPALADPHRKLDWRGIAATMDQLVLPGEPIVVPNDWPIVCLDHYLAQRGRSVEFVKIWESADRGQEVVDRRPRGWLLSAGSRRSNDARRWMFGFVPVLRQPEEEFALFYFPSLVDLLETRFAAGAGDFFEKQFDSWNRRFDFAGGELSLLGTGWSFVERSGDLNFQWVADTEAQLGLPIGPPRDAEIALRLQPFTYPDAPPQVLELQLGTQVLHRTELDSDWNEIRIPVAADSWSPGANVLTLRFGRATPPREVIEGSQDKRPLAAAVDWLEVVDSSAPPGEP